VRPQGLQQSRNIVTSLLTIIGIGLFALISFKAIHQISDRQYVEGKQKQYPVITVAEAQNILDTAIQPTSGMPQLSTSQSTHSVAITNASSTFSDDKQVTTKDDDQQPHNRNDFKKGKELKHYED
jgi:hypothetical protein